MATYAQLQNADSIEVVDIRAPGPATPAFSQGIKSDTITELTGGVGVTVASLLIKSGKIPNLAFTAWVPTFTGFSADPVGGIYRYFTIGKLCIVFVYQPNTGTSNSTGFQILAPLQAAATGMFAEGSPWSIFDNSAAKTTPGNVAIASSGTNFIISTSFLGSGSSWTASGGKSASFILPYETV